jgi:hypothetical protein
MKPILFSTPMVRAILDGRKTQTRRIVKPQPSSGIRKSVFVKSGLEDGHGREIKPRYQPSDILWVRETWQDMSNNEGDYVYLADGDKGLTEWSITTKQLRWKPSIHMPREAARIFLRVTNVRVERVQDITIKDIRSEGTTLSKTEEPEVSNEAYLWFEFQNLWNSTVKKSDLDTYGWNANPWVWVYEFEREQ